VAQRRAVFAGQVRRHVLETDILDRAIEVDRAVLDIAAVEHRENALAHRRDFAEPCDVAVLEHDAPAFDDDEARRVLRSQPRA
jgi:hypothetical protein